MKALLHRMAPTVDEVSLATDVYLPAGPGPFPTILVRTPYHRSGLQGQARPFVERGYAFVAQDRKGGTENTIKHAMELGVQVEVITQ